MSWYISLYQYIVAALQWKSFIKIKHKDKGFLPLMNCNMQYTNTHSYTAQFFTHILTLKPLLPSYGAGHPERHSFHETSQDDSRSPVVPPPQQDNGQCPSIPATTGGYREQCRDAASAPSHQISLPYYKLKCPFENSTQNISKIQTVPNKLHYGPHNG